ncbi:hypothetical protein [Algoriphagus sp.]|uniref:hypothetical protein n=1 Tax=Algoriphagus sp. TaxID=1872435 RepID=UPI00391B1D9F
MRIPLLIISFLVVVSNCMAQSPVSGFLKKKGEGSVVISQFRESYEKVFLVPTEIDGVPVFNDVAITSTSLYAEYGLSDRFNLIVNLPYIKSEGNASQAVLENNGFENTRSGIQDLKIYGKYSLLTKEMGSSKFDLLGAAGLETPLGNYSADEGLQSIIAIGNRSTRFSAFGIGQFSTESGLFATGQLGYSLRSNQVPNALLSEFKLGYAGSAFYVDAFVASQLSDKSGVDILGEGFTGFFPATRVNFTRIGANVYVPLAKFAGLVGGVSSVVAGRNIGNSVGFYGGLAFSF